MNCSHENSVKDCIAVRRTGPPARCMNCKAGRVNEEKNQGIFVSPRKERPVGSGRIHWDDEEARFQEKPTANNEQKRTATDKKEDLMDAATAKAGILRVLGNKGPMTSSGVKPYAANNMERGEYDAAVKELIQEGKVLATDGQREGSILLRLPGTAAPSEKTRKDAPRKSAPVKAPVVKDTGIKSDGIGKIIESLTFQRDKIDAAIAALKAL